MAADSLRETRGKAATELSELMEAEELTDEQYARAEQLDGEISDLDKRIELKKEQMAERAERALAKPVMEITSTPTVANSGEELSDYMRWFNSGGRYERTMNTATDASIIPTDLSTEMIRKLGEVSAIRQCPSIDVVNYESDTELSAINARLTVVAASESGPTSESNPTTRKITFKALKSGVFSALTNEVIADSRPDIVQEVLLQQAEAHGLYWEGQYATSDGKATTDGDTTEGIMVSPTQYDAEWTGAAPNADAEEVDYITTNAGTKIQSIISCVEEKVPAQYWGRGGSWIMGQSFYAELLKLLDGDNRPLFQPYLEASAANGLQRGSLLGRPVFVTSQAPTVSSTGDVHAVFVSGGTFRIADRGGFQSMFDPYTLATSEGAVKYISWMRSDARFLTKGEGITYLVK